MARRRDVVRSLRLPRGEVDRLTRILYAAKAKHYRDTLRELTERYGAGRRVVLSPEIRAAIERESRAHARLIVQTQNRFLRGEAERRRDLSGDELLDHLRGYMDDRIRNRAAVISRTELATVKLDAQVAFFRENGIEPRFEFAGPPAKCPVCRKLKAEGPFGIDVVLAVGYPHIGCRHNWRVRPISAAKLRAGGIRPGQISAGRGRVSGIVGGDPLVSRTGSTSAAVEALDRILADAR